MLVVDASVLATALADGGEDGHRARARLRGARLAAPDLLDLEVTSVLRRQVASGALLADQAARTVDALLALPLERVPAARLVARCWELRDNMTIYDAAYVALAESLQVPLLTADARLAAAPGPKCSIELLRRPPAG